MSTYKIIGSLLIVSGCGGFGFAVAFQYRRQEKMLMGLIHALELMSTELRYRLTPLPSLCRMTGTSVGGAVGRLFLDLAKELERRASPDALSCMRAVLGRSKIPPGPARLLLAQLGGSLGTCDMDGQEKGLERIRKLCKAELDEYRLHYRERTRCYKTLGMCAGIAIAIIFS